MCVYIYIYIYIYCVCSTTSLRGTKGVPFLAFGRLARPRVWSCTSAQSCAIAQWLKGAAAPTLRTQTKTVHEFYCTDRDCDHHLFKGN